jgi:CheY-like chemotaxis protein
MDVHQATISVAVMDASGKLIMECLLETKAVTIVEFIQGLHGLTGLWVSSAVCGKVMG